MWQDALLKLLIGLIFFLKLGKQEHDVLEW